MAGIHAAFEEMICEMDYDSITVKELCARAMISKKDLLPLLRVP